MKFSRFLTNTELKSWLHQVLNIMQRPQRIASQKSRDLISSVAKADHRKSLSQVPQAQPKPTATNQIAPKDIWVAYPLPKDVSPLEKLVARVVSGQISERQAVKESDFARSTLQKYIKLYKHYLTCAILCPYPCMCPFPIR